MKKILLLACAMTLQALNMGYASTTSCSPRLVDTGGSDWTIYSETLMGTIEYSSYTIAACGYDKLSIDILGTLDYAVGAGIATITVKNGDPFPYDQPDTRQVLGVFEASIYGLRYHILRSAPSEPWYGYIGDETIPGYSMDMRFSAPRGEGLDGFSLFPYGFALTGCLCVEKHGEPDGDDDYFFHGPKGGFTAFYSPNLAPVPVPASGLLLGAAVLGGVIWKRRRRMAL